MTTRRSFLTGLLGLGLAPAIVRADSLMRIIVPKQEIILLNEGDWLTVSNGGTSVTLTRFCQSTFSDNIQIHRGIGDLDICSQYTREIQMLDLTKYLRGMNPHIERIDEASFACGEIIWPTALVR